MPDYHVDYRQDPDTYEWTASVRGEPPLVATGPSLAAARARVLEALASADPEPVRLVGHIDRSPWSDLWLELRQALTLDAESELGRLEA